MNAFKIIFKEGRKPQYLWVDEGIEFYNKHLKGLLEQNSIQVYSMENEEKVVFVNNGIEQTKMWKQFAVQGNTKYLDII